jgi:hypothetical protein
MAEAGGQPGKFGDNSQAEDDEFVEYIRLMDLKYGGDSRGTPGAHPARRDIVSDKSVTRGVTNALHSKDTGAVPALSASLIHGGAPGSWTILRTINRVTAL